MRFSRPYRKKRKVLLPYLPTTKSTHSTMSDWIPPTDNVPQREDNWFRSVYTSHRAFCGCLDPVRHLAAVSAALGFQPPPSRGSAGSHGTPAIVRALPALPAAPTSRPPPCGGDGGRGAGEGRQDAGGDGGADDFQQDDVDELLNMLDDAE